jgi:PilZ domain
MSKIFQALRRVRSSGAPQTPLAVLREGRANGWDRRRSSRRAFDAIIRAYGRKPSEQPFYEEARTINVGIHGALLLMAMPVEDGQKLFLINEVIHDQQICRIVYTRSRNTERVEVAVEFPAPHGEFWTCPQARDQELRFAENRRFRRIILSNGTLLIWKNSKQRVISRLDSLSPGGLFVNAPDPPSEGDIIDLCFKVPGTYVRGPGIVRHSHKGKGMGIQFTFINQEARARLAHLLDKLLTSSPKT